MIRTGLCILALALACTTGADRAIAADQAPALPQASAMMGILQRGANGHLKIDAEPAGPAAEPLGRRAEQLVSTPADFRAAVMQAVPGEVITLTPGVWKLGKTVIRRPGTADRPITVRGAGLGEVHIESNTVELFKIAAPYWVFENLDIAGVCAADSDCEHAFHIVGGADGTVIRNNRLHDFNAEIKGNGEHGRFPNNVLIEGNSFYNSHPRDTRHPTHPIDVVGGSNWVVRGNLIADFGKVEGVSYGGFLKGNSRNGLFEKNLVACELTRRGSSRAITIGLSFGGGGAPDAICEHHDCSSEHTGGAMRNNIIMNCPTDVGIYLNKATRTRIVHNTLYDTFGIDVRFSTSSAIILNNIVSGGVRNRDGGTSVAENNLIAGNRFSSGMPGLARFIKSKIEGATRKYPNVFRFDRESAYRAVDETEEWLAVTWLGRGTNTLSALFQNPTAGMFGAALGRELPVAKALPDVVDDICGTPRRNPTVHLGAVEDDECALPAELIRRYLHYARSRNAG